MERLLKILRSVGLVFGGLLIVAGLGLVAASIKASAGQDQRFEPRRFAYGRGLAGQRT